MSRARKIRGSNAVDVTAGVVVVVFITRDFRLAHLVSIEVVKVVAEVAIDPSGSKKCKGEELRTDHRSRFTNQKPRFGTSSHRNLLTFHSLTHPDM